ncbi:MAG TPA: amidohydrolase [Candidatus Cloacimonadota bacterium]|nr:amidohydrolase [Candidatus Cloacimonadota bacterium]
MNYIIVNAPLYDNQTGMFSTGKSILIADGLIKHIGHLSECIAYSPRCPEILDLRGKVVLPSFTDTHTHFVELAKRRIMVDLQHRSTINEVIGELSSFRNTHEALPEWILGGGWDKNKIDEPESLNRQLLDSVFSDLPVALWSKDYHAKLCNSLALRLAGITDNSPDPAGGRYGRASDGTLNGIVYESASDAMEKVISQPGLEILKQAVLRTVREAHQFGLTGAHTMEGAYSWSVLESLRDLQPLCRFTWHFPPEELENLGNSGMKTHTGDNFYRIGGMKLFADGALGSQTAAMFEPYTGSDNLGILRYTDEELRKQAEEAVSAGFALSIHAIGTKAVHQVLSLYKDLNTRYPNPGHRIEHLQSIRREDLPLLRESGAFCALQPVHLAGDIPNIEKHWQAIRHLAYCFKDILAYCRSYGFGSDAPIESHNPFLGIYTALQRKAALDPGSPSWIPEQKLKLQQAIFGYTAGAAIISGTDSHLGKLLPGYYADLMVLDDFRDEPDEFWLDASPRMLFCGGEPVLSDL